MADGDVHVDVTSNDGEACNVFDGVNDYIELPDATIFKTTVGSIEIKFKTDLATNDTIFSAGNSGSDNPYFLIRSRNVTGTIEISGRDDAAGNSISLDTVGVTIDDGDWHHLIITADETDYICYIDGVVRTLAVLLGSNNGKWFGETGYTFDQFTLGALARTAVGNFYTGEESSFRIYNVVLTQAEVTAANQGTHITRGLVGEFNLYGDYTNQTGLTGVATNHGSTTALSDGKIKNAVKAERVLTSAAGKFLMCSGHHGQVVTAGIVES